MHAPLTLGTDRRLPGLGGVAEREQAKIPLGEGEHHLKSQTKQRAGVARCASRLPKVSPRRALRSAERDPAAHALLAPALSVAGRGEGGEAEAGAHGKSQGVGVEGQLCCPHFQVGSSLSALGSSQQDAVGFQSFQVGSWFVCVCFLYKPSISTVMILSREVTSVS